MICPKHDTIKRTGFGKEPGEREMKKKLFLISLILLLALAAAGRCLEGNSEMERGTEKDRADKVG